MRSVCHDLASRFGGLSPFVALLLWSCRVLAWPCLVLAVALLVPAPGAGADDPDLPFERCRTAGAEPTSGTALLSLISVGRDDEESRSTARLSWTAADDTRLRVEMLSPEEIAGSSLLLVKSGDAEPEAWAWLPEVDRVRRVSGRHLSRSLFGTNLRYADLERARQLVTGDGPDAWSETRYRGRPVWKLLERDGRDTVVTWLDREHCVPLRTEISDRKGRVARWVEVSSEPADAAAGSFIPGSLVVRDVLDETETRVEVESIDLDPAPPVAVFDPEWLGRRTEPTPES